jgi:hypothetical protein
MKAIRLLMLVAQRPGEFLDRLSATVASRLEISLGRRPDYRTVDVEEGFVRLCEALGSSVSLRQPDLARIEARIKKRQAQLPANAPFARFHNGDTVLGRLCYVVARSLRPKVIIETGVCYGVTSSYLLHTLAADSEGHLHSIDLPPLGQNGDGYLGWLVPEELRARWTLHRGTSRRLLPLLLSKLGEVDLFVHDSLHTYGNMKREFAAAWPALRAGGVLISDDVEYNGAFLELVQRDDAVFSMVIKEGEKNALFGVAVKRA